MSICKSSQLSHLNILQRKIQRIFYKMYRCLFLILIKQENISIQPLQHSLSTYFISLSYSFSYNFSWKLNHDGFVDATNSILYSFFPCVFPETNFWFWVIQINFYLTKCWESYHWLVAEDRTVQYFANHNQEPQGQIILPAFSEAFLEIFWHLTEQICFHLYKCIIHSNCKKKPVWYAWRWNPPSLFILLCSAW